MKEKWLAHRAVHEYAIVFPSILFTLLTNNPHRQAELEEWGKNPSKLTKAIRRLRKCCNFTSSFGILIFSNVSNARNARAI